MIISNNANRYLSVAIPTYNRPAELANCLESIMPQAKQYSVPIYVSDNASDYDISEIIERYDYPLLFYNRNSSNIGASANVEKVLSAIKSDYVWLFSDDDTMKKGAIKEIITYCQSASYALIVPNYDHFTVDEGGTISYSNIKFPFVDVATEFKNSKEVLSLFGYSHCALFSCLIIRIKDWREIDGTKYTLNSRSVFFEYFNILCEMIIDKSVLVLPSIVISVRRGNAHLREIGWQVSGYYFICALNELPDYYTMTVKRKVMNSTTRGRPIRHFAYGREGGWISWSNVSKITKPYLKLKAYYLVALAWLFIFVPSPIIRLVHYMYNIPRQRKK